MSRLIDLDLTRKVHISKVESAIELMDLIQDAIPEEFYDNLQAFYDSKEEPPPTKSTEVKKDRTVEERLDRVKCFTCFDIHECISLRAFKNIPIRMLSAREF